MMLRGPAAAALSEAGYALGRRIDVHPLEEALRKEGFLTTPAVRRFLAEFGDLTLSLPHPSHRTVTISIHFNAARAAAGVYREQIEVLEERIGAPLCPIGEALGGVLLMDPTGAIYAALDDWFVRLGMSPEEALEELCSGGSGTVLGL
jgi:hypothetical protein